MPFATTHVGRHSVRLIADVQTENRPFESNDGSNRVSCKKKKKKTKKKNKKRDT